MNRVTLLMHVQIQYSHQNFANFSYVRCIATNVLLSMHFVEFPPRKQYPPVAENRKFNITIQFITTLVYLKRLQNDEEKKLG